MQRYPLKWRQTTYTETDFYQLVPISRKPVAPGERVSKLVVDMRFQSAVFDKANLTPVLVQCWAFYIPHRLIWDQWVDFIALDDAVTAVPQTSIAAPIYLEAGSGARSSLFRRAYKYTYNQYFGDETQAANGAWFTSFGDDSVVALGRLLVWDQFRAHTRAATYTQSSFSAAVSGAVASIPLDDFRKALRSNDARRRQKLTGDKYVDTMRLMGVELDWRIQMAPEFLGSSQQVMFGEVIQSAAADLGVRASEWRGQHQLVCKRPLAFAEHGTIMVCAGFRPCMAAQGITAQDASQLTPDAFFRPDTAGGPYDSSGTSLQYDRFAIYSKGRNQLGNNENGYVFTQSGSTAIYPDPTGFVPISGSGPRHLSLFTDLSYGGLTPVPPGRA